jgi:hypothetical protein
MPGIGIGIQTCFSGGVKDILISPANYDDWSNPVMAADINLYGSNTKALVDGFMAITYVDNQSGASRRFRVEDQLGVDLEDGEAYRLDIKLRQSDGAGAGFRILDGTDWSNVIPITSNWVLYQITFTRNTGDPSFAFRSLGSGDVVQIDTMKLYKLK